jgi:hypothetical protein
MKSYASLPSLSNLESLKLRFLKLKSLTITPHLLDLPIMKLFKGFLYSCFASRPKALICRQILLRIALAKLRRKLWRKL